MTIEPFETSFVPDVCAVDFLGRWQPGSVFRAMQEAGGAQCEQYGLAYAELSRHGLAWVLARAAVHMDKYPLYGQTVTVRTWPTAGRHAFFPRQFEFFADGEPVGCATSLYLLFDLDERKSAPPARLPSPVPVCDRPAPMAFAGNVRSLDAPTALSALTPGYHDIDMNGHVNNTRYVDWFCDQFPCDRHRGRMLVDLLVNYHFELHPDEPVTLSLQDMGDLSVMCGLRGDECCFKVEGRWRERQA